MRIYTRTGDRGFTMLPGPGGRGGLRVRKDDPRVVALAALDELSAFVGLAAGEAGRTGSAAIRKRLLAVQEKLFRCGAVLLASAGGEPPRVRLDPGTVRRMEKDIDAIGAKLPKLANFIFPGGCELAGRLHVARAVARRAEHALAAAVRLIDPALRAGTPLALAAIYLNRLSDYLFLLARLANHQAGSPEVVWKGRTGARGS